MKPRHPHRPGSRQRGVATLVVVAVLFFVLSLVAAYTNRSMIFEQRTASNQYRSTLAFEAAEAGLEWALSMLNGGRVDASCVPSANVADTSFRQRYLTIDPATGHITPTGVLAADLGSDLWPSCVFDGTDWRCSCPAAGAPVLAAPAGSAVYPAFRIRMVQATPPQPGVVTVQVNGCTRLQNECLDFPSLAVGGEGRATVQSLVALRGGLGAPPVAAVTVRRAVNAANVNAYNDNAAVGGVAVLAGGPIAGLGSTGTVAGAPGTTAIVSNDPGLQALTGDRLFSNTFSVDGTTYRNQPGAVIPNCLAVCNANEVRQVASLNPGRVIWVNGNLNLDAGGDLGSATEPVLIVATGNINVSVNVFGLLYGGKDVDPAPGTDTDWDTTGSGPFTVRGAVIAERDLLGAGQFTTVYDADILTRLRWQSGSFVRVPGGWKDY